MKHVVANSGKALLKRTFEAFGLDVCSKANRDKILAKTWEEKQYQLWRPFLAHHNIQTVIDVGANDGQFAEMIHRHFPQSQILCFEPLETCETKLHPIISRFTKYKLFKAAAGDKEGRVSFFQSEFSPCSSLLPGTDNLGETYKEASNIKQLSVPVVRIDNALADETLQGEILVKFDVQGYEMHAINGAIETLKQASVIVIETCFFRKLYQDQPLFRDIFLLLDSLGFYFAGNAEQHIRPSDNRIVEADAIFERR
jgi:FkbM family methyltransferase